MPDPTAAGGVLLDSPSHMRKIHENDAGSRPGGFILYATLRRPSE
jgi:hypothetical protein